jgi:3-phosphoglycerate kinase
MFIKSIRQAKKITGKKIFLRVDFNVPLDDRGKILDKNKIIASLPTIRFLLRNKCKVIIATHITNEKLKIKNEKFITAKPLANILSKLLGKKIIFINSCVGVKVKKKVEELKEKQILMLENLRSNPGEKNNDLKFARDLAQLADIYINDAFAASHRQHASLCAIKNYLPSYAGLLLEKEVTHLNKILHPARPFVMVMGGVKVETKLPIINNLAIKADYILLGGHMADIFLKLLGKETGKTPSPVLGSREKGKKYGDRDIKYVYRKFKKKIILPVDLVVSEKNDGTAPAKIKDIDSVGEKDYILDIGPKTILLYAEYIKKARTIIWNGPMGKFEVKPFRHGTLALAQLIAARSQGYAFGAVGGGETIEALKMIEMENYIDWISTGGGAMLYYLGGGKMPGLEKITDYHSKIFWRKVLN